MHMCSILYMYISVRSCLMSVVYIFIYIYKYIYTYIYIYVCVCVCVCLCVCVCVLCIKEGNWAYVAALWNNEDQ